MKLDVGWGYALFHFPMEITGQMVRQEPRTKHLKKEDVVGIFDFDVTYLESMESDTMFHDMDGEVKYYFVYFMTVTD